MNSRPSSVLLEDAAHGELLGLVEPIGDGAKTGTYARANGADTSADTGAYSGQRITLLGVVYGFEHCEQCRSACGDRSRTREWIAMLI